MALLIPTALFALTALAVLLGDISPLLLYGLGGLTFAAILCETLERSLIHRRLWVRQIFRPESTFSTLLRGGLLFCLFHGAAALPWSLLFIASALIASPYEWGALTISLLVTLTSVRLLQRRVGAHVVPALAPYVARRGARLIVLFCLVPSWLLVKLYLPQPDLSELSAVQVMAQVEEAHRWLPEGFRLLGLSAAYLDRLSLWAIQLTGQPGASFQWLLQTLLIIAFCLHSVAFLLSAQRLLLGLIALGELSKLRQGLTALKQIKPEQSEHMKHELIQSPSVGVAHRAEQGEH